ncbi:MAG: chemotaxis response regulator protein-glutamate methylesterase [Actinobacteria bacterium]|nr:chemotaxis response regulator protein-glutamate methylesterase [Actinomycetota bacterium]
MASAARVIVVDDSALMRTLISDVLSKADDIDVLDTARDGEDALKKIAALDPDVITLDVEMPRMNGLEVLMELQGRPRPQVIMLSGVTDPDVAYEALELGALDFVLKPSGTISVNIDELGEDLREKVRAAAAVVAPLAQHPVLPGRPQPGARPFMPVVAVAASTGGPMALDVLFAGLPGDLEAAIVVVQHLPVGFSRSLAQRLDRVSELEVGEAVDGQVIRVGHAYLAPPGSQLKFGKNGSSKTIELTDEKGYGRFKPSADVTLSSLAEVFGPRGIGVVLTGMGADGCQGMTMLKAKKATTIAQDRETSVVYGMPKACIDAGVVSEVLPLHRIGPRLVELISDARRRRR